MSVIVSISANRLFNADIQIILTLFERNQKNMKYKPLLFLRHEPDMLSIYEKISICIIFMSDAIIMTGKFSVAYTADWLVVLVGAFISIPFIISASFIIRRCNGSILLRFLSVFISLSSVMISLYIFSDFVKKCVSPRISILLIPAGILITAFYSAFRTAGTLCRAVHIVMPVIIIFSATAATIAMTRFRTDNITDSAFLMPAAAISASSTFAAVYTIKAALLLYLFSFGKNNRNDCAAICTGTLIYASVMSLMLFTALGVLGAGLYSHLDYPLYYPLGLTGIGDYFERTEVISVIIFMIILTFKSGIFIRIILIACNVRKQAHL